MSKISDERLDEFLVGWPITAQEKGRIARELRDYRKAVREYLSAVDTYRAKISEESYIKWADTEATLRALEERT